jgi:hypothetical protein
MKLLLELCSRHGADGTVQPLPIRDFFEKMFEACSRFADALIFEERAFLVLQRLAETLSFGLIVSIAPASHADPDALFCEYLGVSQRCILHALI